MEATSSTTNGAETSPEVEIRVAVPNDLAAIRAIEVESFSDPWSVASFRALFGRSGVEFLLVSVDGEAAGFAVAQLVGDEAEIANFAVAERYRRHGIGRLLLSEVVGRLRSAGAREAWLEVRASNAAALALYRSFGFEEIIRRRGYYARPVEDAVCMRCSFGPAAAAAEAME